jgi:hypothetical protein
VGQRDRPRFDIAISAASALSEGPAVSAEGLLSDPKTREHLRNGFPARIHYRLELWRKGGVFDDIAGRTEWDVLVNYDPSTQLYNVVRRTANDQVRENFGGFASVTSADAQLARPFRTSLHPNRSGRYYYHLIVEVQTLTESDLDALQQWLHGPTAPGKTNNPLTVVRSGLGTLFSRVLGGAQRSYDQTSGVFRVE